MHYVPLNCFQLAASYAHPVYIPKHTFQIPSGLYSTGLRSKQNQGCKIARLDPIRTLSATELSSSNFQCACNIYIQGGWGTFTITTRITSLGARAPTQGKELVSRVWVPETSKEWQSGNSWEKIPKVMDRINWDAALIYRG